MTRNEGEAIVGGFRGKTILVVGDIMLDTYFWGAVQRISPEAPVPVVELLSRSHRCGGAANVAANIAALGATPLLVGVVGSDSEGAELRTALREMKISDEHILTDESRPTTTKLRIVAHGQQIARVDSELRSEMSECVEQQLLGWVETAVARADACAISDYAKGVVSEKLSQRVITTAKDLGKPVVVDPKGVMFSKYRGATVVTPNLKEAEILCGLTVEVDQDFDGLARVLAARLSGSALIITRGKSGMTVCHDGNGHVNIPATAKNVYDVTGAGDTVVSVVTMSLASGASLIQAAALANQAAGLVVAKVGTACITAEELLLMIENAPVR